MTTHTETPERVRSEYDRQKERLAMPLGRRIGLALTQARVLSHASAAGVEQHVQSGKASTEPPPAIEGGLYEDGDIVALFTRRFQVLVAALEREVDAHLRRPLAGRVDEDGDEKDARIVRDFEGYSSTEVAFIDPTLGSPRTIERARARHDRRPSNGRLKR